MSLRGRGTLEIKPNSNPFLQPVSGDYGIRPNEQIEWKVGGKAPLPAPSTHKVDGNFSFLYSRESDKIGGRLAKPHISQPRVLTKTEFLKKKREEMEAMMMTSEFEREEPVRTEAPRRSAEDMCKLYNHKPREEDPRYTTSNNDYGSKAPSVATIVVDRAGIPQGFSKSFNNIKPKNTSLTTAISRSSVHGSLDPQFA